MKLITKFLLLCVALHSTLSFANHDDTNIVGLLVTVTGNTNGQVSIDVSGQGDSSSQLPGGALGSQFYYDDSTSTSLFDRWVTPVPPAVDWGDGSVVANTVIPFTGTDTVTGNPTFTGQFMHTYAAPGNYTIRSFGTNIYAQSNSYSLYSGNVFSVTSPVISTDGASTYVRFTGAGAIGVTATATVSPAGVGPVAPPAMIPSSSNLTLLLMGLLLSITGFVVLRRA